MEWFLICDQIILWKGIYIRTFTCKWSLRKVIVPLKPHVRLTLYNSYQDYDNLILLNIFPRLLEYSHVCITRHPPKVIAYKTRNGYLIHSLVTKDLIVSFKVELSSVSLLINEAIPSFREKGDMNKTNMKYEAKETVLFTKRPRETMLFKLNSINNNKIQSLKFSWSRSIELD